MRTNYHFGILNRTVVISLSKNGINIRWSNGVVEGHVNLLKSIKRQMYGRASFELLKKKVILSQSG